MRGKWQDWRMHVHSIQANLHFNNSVYQHSLNIARMEINSDIGRAAYVAPSNGVHASLIISS